MNRELLGILRALSQRIAYWGVGVIASLGVLSLTWVGGELHYGNCLASVDLRYPAAFQPSAGGETQTLRERFGIEGEAGRASSFVFYDRASRNTAISDCSRWP